MEHLSIPNAHKEIISKLNFSKFKKDLIKEINIARGDPKIYLEKIQKLLNELKSSSKGEKNVITINGIQVHLIEGLSVLESAIEYLKNQKSVQKLKLINAMDDAAQELLNHLIAREGLIDTEQILYKDIYDPETRLNKFGACFGAVDEIIDCGCFDAELLVISLIIGDGDENRLERNTLFLEEFKYCGIATFMLPSQRICSVINICEEFVSPGEYIPKNLRKVKFNDDEFRDIEGSTTINNKLYLSKKIYEKVESDYSEKSHKSEKSECNKRTDFTDTDSSTDRNKNMNKKTASGNRDRRKSSLMTYAGKKNSIDKFLNFSNNKEKYLKSIIERLSRKDQYSIDDENDDEDTFEYYEIQEEITTKKCVSRRNKNSIVSFNEIEELEREKNQMNLPKGIYKISWNEKKIIDPKDKKGYFIVEKKIYKDDGEILRIVYTKY